MEQSALHDHLKKQNPTINDMEIIVRTLNQGSYNMPDASFEYSYRLLSKNSNSSQNLISAQELIHSGLEMSIPPPTLKYYLKWLMEKIGGNRYVSKLTALINFASNSEQSSNHLEALLKEDLSDNDTKKKILSQYKRQGRMDVFIGKINQFLKENPNDEQAWLELAQAYTEKGQYMRAVFCFEELVILCPENNHYSVRLGELYYTQGGKSNIDAAIKYFSSVVAKTPNNYRALWNLHKALENIDDAEYSELREKTRETIQKFYRESGTGIRVEQAF